MIVFDLGEVYIQGLVGVENHLTKILNIEKDEIWKALDSPMKIPYFKGLINEDEYLKDVIDKGKWLITLSKLKDTIRMNFTENVEVKEIIEELYNRQYSLGLLSVHGKEWIDFIRNKYDHEKYFDSIGYSFELHLLKDNIFLFKEYIRINKIDTSTSIFIDDQVSNLDIARRCGFKVHQFVDDKELRKFLIKNKFL